MAGAKVTIDVDDAPARDLADHIDAFAGEPQRMALLDIGEYMLRSTRERAAQEITPDGVPWVPLSEEYKAHKDRVRPGVPMLKFDWHMLGDQFSYLVGDGLVDIGTNAPYGALHQWGGQPSMAPGPAAVPAREWLGTSADDLDEILAIYGDHLQASLD
jgi:phage virion morphogenesis protein